MIIIFITNFLYFMSILIIQNNKRVCQQIIFSFIFLGFLVYSKYKLNCHLLKFKLVVNDKDEYERLKLAIKRKINEIIKID